MLIKVGTYSAINNTTEYSDWLQLKSHRWSFTKNRGGIRLREKEAWDSIHSVLVLKQLNLNY